MSSTENARSCVKANDHHLASLNYIELDHNEAEVYLKCALKNLGSAIEEHYSEKHRVDSKCFEHVQIPEGATIQHYVERLDTYGKTSKITLIYAYIYLLRAQRRGLRLSFRTAFKLFGLSYVAAAKFLEQSASKMPYKAKVVGLTIWALLDLEQYFNNHMDYDFFVDPDELNSVVDSLIKYQPGNFKSPHALSILKAKAQSSANVPQSVPIVIPNRSKPQVRQESQRQVEPQIKQEQPKPVQVHRSPISAIPSRCQPPVNVSQQYRHSEDHVSVELYQLNEKTSVARRLTEARTCSNTGGKRGLLSLLLKDGDSSSTSDSSSPCKESLVDYAGAKRILAYYPAIEHGSNWDY